MYVISAVRANELRQEAATQAQPLSAPSAPTGLSATTTRPGSVILTWTNPADFVDQSDDVEIWVSDDNNRENATLLHVELGNVTNFTYTTAGAGTKFYWVRVRRLTNQLKSKKLLTSAYHPTSATGGVTGTSKILSPDVQLSHGAINFFFDSDGVLDPSGAAQDVTVTATLLNLTATPTFSLVEADGTSQSDITFTTGATSLSGSSATVDASSASVSTTPKLLKVTVTESGETFTRQIPIGILRSGSIGVDGADGLRTIQGYLYYESTGSTAPSAPSGNTYTFTTGVVTGTGINDSGTTNVWKNSPNTTDATSTNTYWTVRYFGTEASANSSTISVTYSNVVQFTNFDGVVTFSNGTFSQVGGTDITTIDGGNIDTGTITADAINTSSITLSTFSNSGTGYVNASGAAAAAPVQSVNGSTGTVSITAAGLNILSTDVSGLADSATETIANIRAGTTKANVGLSNVDNDSTATIRAGTTAANVGLGNVENKDAPDQVKEAFSEATEITAGNIFIGAQGSSTTNFIELNAANATIIIADNS
jgi:hypothetical protein